MKAKIVEIISGSGYPDGKIRIKLKFEDAEGMFKELKVPAEMLPVPIILDGEIEFNVFPVSSVVKVLPLPTEGDEVAIHEAHEGGEMFRG